MVSIQTLKMKIPPTLAIAFPVLLTTSVLHGAVFTYTGVSGTENWSDGVDWDATPISAIDTNLVFTGDLGDGAIVGSINDVADPFQLNRIDYTYTGFGSGTAAEVTISGGQLNFINDGSNDPILDLSPVNGNPTPNLTISNNLLLSNDLTINTRNNLTILSGQISGSGGINVTDNQATSSGNVWTTVLTNTGNNYQGDTQIGATGTSGGERRLQLGASEVIPNGAGFGNLVINTSSSGGRVARFQLNGFNETVNGVVAAISPGSNANGDSGQSIMNGNATPATLTFGDNDATAEFYGSFLDGAGGGALSLTKIGSGIQTLGGRNTNTGATMINGGGVIIDFNSFAGVESSDAIDYFSPNSDLTLAGGTSFAIEGRADGGAINQGSVSYGRFSSTITLPNEIVADLVVGQEIVVSDLDSDANLPATGVFIVSFQEPGATTTVVNLNKRPIVNNPETGTASFSTGTASTSATDASTVQNIASITFSGADGENVTIDFGTSDNVTLLINAAPVQLNDGSTVTLANWSGIPVAGGGDDQWIFTGNPSEFTSVFDQSEIIFDGYGAGYNLIDLGGSYEITPVPEPTTYALILACGALFVAIRRRR